MIVDTKAIREAIENYRIGKVSNFSFKEFISWLRQLLDENERLESLLKLTREVGEQYQKESEKKGKENFELHSALSELERENERLRKENEFLIAMTKDDREQIQSYYELRRASEDIQAQVQEIWECPDCNFQMICGNRQVDSGGHKEYCCPICEISRLKAENERLSAYITDLEKGNHDYFQRSMESRDQIETLAADKAVLLEALQQAHSCGQAAYANLEHERTISATEELEDLNWIISTTLERLKRE